MRNFPLRRDLGLQLLTLWLLFVVLVILAVLVFEGLASRRLAADIKAADLALARAVAQETNATMENALTAVRQISAYPEVSHADIPGMERLFPIFLSGRSDINLIYRLNEQGIMIYHYPVTPNSTVGEDFSFRDYFQAATQTNTHFVSKGRISPTTNQPVATAVMPLWGSDGEFAGIVGTNLKLQTLSSSLAGIAQDYPPEEGFQILILDNTGQIIAHPQADILLQDGSTSMPAVYEAVQNGTSGNLIASSADGDELLFSYVPITSVGWGVVVSRPTAVAFATPTIFRRGAVFTIVIFILAGILFWLILSRRVIRPLERLAEFSQTVGLPDDAHDEHVQMLTTLTERPDQMGHLTRSLTRMQQAIEARLNELAILLQTSTAVVSSLDADTVLDRILEQVQNLLDVQMCAIFARDEMEGIFRIQASRGLSQWYTEHAIIDPNDPSSVTMRAIRSGEPIQISDTETNPSFVGHRDRARIAGYRAVLAVPLNVQHAPASALLVFRPDAHIFTSREINLLSSFANHAAMAIENATLYAHSDMRLQEQTRRLEALIQSLQDGLILEDLQGRVLYANRRMADLTGLSAETMPGQDVAALMARLYGQAVDAQAARTAVAQAVSGRQPRADFAIHGRDRTHFLRLKMFDVTDSQGTAIGHGRIIQDITQRHEVDQMKSSLISTVSHELRTPLAAIKGYTTTLLADDVEWDGQSQREFLEIISDRTDHLNDLVGDLLDMSRIEAGSLQVVRQDCELGDMVAQAARNAHPQPGNRLHVNLPPNLPPLAVDRRRITAVLRNLIENAAKYGGEDGPICVTAVAENGHVIVRVSDEGPGVPADLGEQIFSSFYRVENGLTRQTAGAGLGLAISRGFIRAHGGDIWLESPAQGTCIAFSLPLTEPEAV